MEIDVSKFGEILVSRPAGREAFLMAQAYLFSDLKKDEKILLNFSNVKVLTPSWADEFITGIHKTYGSAIDYLNTQNESVCASLKAIS